ncbi:MAG: ATP-binding cassette domain-containing protein, partial [Saprospiraceae bacterium]|nr:ATP-binding cassette domain-containing protein [Saprospiraceae bacterium]
MDKPVILKVKDLAKTFMSASRSLTVLEDISFEVHEGESIAVVGTSGSGKTTLLGLSAGLDQPTSGYVELCGNNLTKLDEDERARVRNENVGFIFQDFQLIPTLTALENVTIPLELRGNSESTEVSIDLLERVGLKDRLNHYPNQLSGGEQ